MKARNSTPGLSRRSFLSIGAAAAASTWLLPACAGDAPATPPPSDGGRDATPLSDGGLDATPECRETEDNILGPYYRPGSPFRADLVSPGMPGTRLSVAGRVLGAGCASGLAGALLDIWQADDAGHYDNDGSINPLPPDLFILRGRLNTDSEGGFEFRSIVPGRYLNGNTYRPAHIHVIASAPGHRMLTTQLYFAGDPFNGTDPFIRPSLIMNPVDVPGGKAARFDFVLASA